MTSTLLATLLLASDGLSVVPLVIVAVVVAYVASAWLPQSPPTCDGVAVDAATGAAVDGADGPSAGR